MQRRQIAVIPAADPQEKVHPDPLLLPPLLLDVFVCAHLGSPDGCRQRGGKSLVSILKHVPLRHKVSQDSQCRQAYNSQLVGRLRQEDHNFKAQLSESLVSNLKVYKMARDVAH